MAASGDDLKAKLVPATTPESGSSTTAAQTIPAQNVPAAEIDAKNLAAIPGIEAKLIRGEVLTKAEKLIVRKKFENDDDEVRDFIGEHYREYYPKTYAARYLGPNFISLSAEVFFGLYMMQTSTDGVASLSNQIYPLPTDSYKPIGYTGATGDFVSNVALMDFVGEANQTLTEHAESKPWRARLGNFVAKFQQTPLKAISDTLIDATNYAVCTTHNVIGAYADVVPIEGWLQSINPVVAWGIRLGFVVAGDTYYGRYLTPAYDAGFSRHFGYGRAESDESLLAKVFRDREFATPIQVASQVGSATFLRALSFMYLNPYLKDALGGAWISDDTAGVVIAYHTWVSRFYSTSGRYYKNLDAAKALVADFSKDKKDKQNDIVMGLTKGGKGIDVSDQTVMDSKYQLASQAAKNHLVDESGAAQSASTKVMIQTLGKKLLAKKPSADILREEYPAVIMSGMRGLVYSYLTDMLLLNTKESGVGAQIGFYCAGAALALFICYRAESERLSYALVVKQLEDVAKAALSENPAQPVTVVVVSDAKTAANGEGTATAATDEKSSTNTATALTSSPGKSKTTLKKSASNESLVSVASAGAISNESVELAIAPSSTFCSKYCTGANIAAVIGIAACLLSQSARAISNLTFADTQAQNRGLDQQVAVAAVLALSGETAVNAFLLNMPRIKATMTSVKQNTGKLLRWMRTGCSTNRNAPATTGYNQLTNQDTDVVAVAPNPVTPMQPANQQPANPQPPVNRISNPVVRPSKSRCSIM